MQSEAERKFRAYMRGFSDAVSGQINRGEYGDEGEWLPYQQGWDSGQNVRKRAEKRAEHEFDYDASKAKAKERHAARLRLRGAHLRRVV